MNNPVAVSQTYVDEKKKNVWRWLQIPVNIVIVFCLVTGSLYMQITAHQHLVNLGWFVSLCAVFSVASVLLYTWEHTGIVEMYIALAAGAYCIFDLETVTSSAKAFIDNFRQRFGLVQYGHIMKPAHDSTLFFVMLALLAALLAAAYLLRSGSIWMTLAIPALSFTLATARFRELCSPVVILAVLSAMLVIMLTHRVRLIDTLTAARQSVAVAVPAVIVLVALTLLIQPDSYRLPEWGQRVREYAGGIISKLYDPEEREEYFGSTQLYRTRFDLSELGPRPSDRRQVMEVRADEQTSLYLRGFSYMGYSGGRWLNETPEQASAFTGVLEYTLCVPENSRSAFRTGTVEIITALSNSMIFMPYTAAEIPEGGACYGDSYVHNKILTNEYSITYGKLSAVNSQRDSEYERLVFEHYLDIPAETADGLKSLAADMGIITAEEAETGCPWNVPAVVDSVTELVTNCAEYDTNVQPMPEGKDFALWFITEAENGYCSHFASATTLMLRAIGVPARFVSGFVAHTVPGEWVKVTGDNAHAWVEYYDRDTGGWVLVDPTPRAALSVVSSGDMHSALTSGTDTAAAPSATDVEPSAVATTTTAAQTAATSSAEQSVTTRTATASTSVPPAVTTSPYGETEDAQSNQDEKAEDTTADRWWIPVVAVPMLPLLAWFVLSRIRKSVCGGRQKRFAEGSNKERIAAMGEYLQVLKDAGGGSWDTQVRKILLKAQFSQHDLTDSELDQVKESVNQSVEALKVNSGLIADFANKFIRFIY